MKKEYKCPHVAGVECKAEKRDCDTCPMWNGPGILPVDKSKLEGA